MTCILVLVKNPLTTQLMLTPILNKEIVLVETPLVRELYVVKKNFFVSYSMGTIKGKLNHL